MLLDKILATTKVVETNTLTRHWTMTGPTYNANHPYFDKIIDILRDLLDYTAELIRGYGDIPIHTLVDMVYASGVREQIEIPDMNEMLLRESIDLKTLVAIIDGGVRAKIFTPGEESKFTAFCSDIQEWWQWIDATIEDWRQIPPIPPASDER